MRDLRRAWHGRRVWHLHALRRRTAVPQSPSPRLSKSCPLGASWQLPYVGTMDSVISPWRSLRPPACLSVLDQPAFMPGACLLLKDRAKAFIFELPCVLTQQHER